jgi:hypothetical protein
MKTPKKKPIQPAKKAESEEPRVFTADIYVSKKLVSSVSLKAGSAGAAQVVAYRLIKVKVK